ncbi:MAG: glycerol-3-phosphate acyltransferase [Coriobacteriia bacterium]|nr:glycerol-3-phosphate acyltransferase [Coriobacteriia bacterium]MBN2823512.1 glycerol-3-phosphate acyltransferase [Coriobacteriia bacterium]
MISGPVSGGWNVMGLTFLLAYLIGSFPNAYFIARHVTGEDITTHGSGNVGAMNVRRTTGSWTWFAVAMSADFIKGLAPVALAKLVVVGGLSLLVSPWGATLASAGTGWWTVGTYYVPMAAVAGAVIGHNYSLWLGIIKKRLLRTGKGLATGAGALLAYDWRFFLAVVIVGLAVIAITHYMMAGQVVASIVLPIAAVVLRSPDWIFAAVMGALVYAAHHKRFIGMLQGKEPKFYIHDRQGPRG